VAPGTLAAAVAELVIDTGPAQLYAVTFDAPLAVRVSVAPAHIGPPFDAPESEGIAVTVAIAVATQPAGIV